MRVFLLSIVEVYLSISLMSGEEVLLTETESTNTSTFQQVDKLFSHNPYKPIQCLIFLSIYHTITHTWKYLAG